MTKIIGLTGGIGSGKSTVASYIASKGIPVYIADEVAKKIMNRKSVVLEVSAIFSEKVLDDKNKLDRKKIASIVFNNPEKLKELNAIIHPKVKTHFLNWLKRHKNHPFVIKEVAILFETGGDKDCDAVILVTAPEELRIQRTILRDNSDELSVRERIKNQLSDEVKKKSSNFIINNVKLENTLKEINKVIEILKNS
ncbi:dephospho-CoA kinase [Flavobacterium sp.]|jgi:dephospho-CoA kinase|uniref:dephospho-CoA kinase n=1 Tax=Flavobacterium sp. TaxID=239 RepID=UPI002A7ED994|nr:dephospho-CoA kinase [Flavobacterium sp.]